jgi:Peroxiredoxin
MKKIVLTLFVSLFSLVHCWAGEPFTIIGKLPAGSMDGLKVYLLEPTDDNSEPLPIDSTEVRNESFEFKGTTEKMPVIRFISVESASTFLLAAEPGNIQINILDTKNYEVGGTPANEEIQSFLTHMSDFSSKARPLMDEFSEAKQSNSLNEEREKEIMKLFDTLQTEYYSNLFDFLKKNIKTPVGEFFYWNSGVRDVFTSDQHLELIRSMNPQTKGSEKVQQLKRQLDLMAATEPGKPFPNATGATPTGEPGSLSDYAGKGKVVLIDFWASWCGPCIREMPNIVSAYEKYKAKGFEIVGVSLDTDKKAWTGAIERLGMTWPQLSDLKGWSSDMGAAYSVTSIPYTVLVDAEGKIISKNLRGTALLDKLEELLK